MEENRAEEATITAPGEDGKNNATSTALKDAEPAKPAAKAAVSTTTVAATTVSAATATQQQPSVLCGLRARGRTDPDLCSVATNDPAAADFPSLYAHLPRFWSIGVENGRVTQEPTSVNLYKADFKDSWILLISFPGVKTPFGGFSVRKILTKAPRFVERNCRVFLLSTDPWTKVRDYRTFIENKVMRPTGTSQGSKLYDVEGVTFITDEQLYVSRKLGLLCEGKNNRKVCFPGYLLLTPDKELVQYCVIRNNKKLQERTDKTYFAYPVTDEVLDNLAECLDTLVPIYNMVRRLKDTYPRASFGTFIENMIILVQKDEKEEEKMKKEKEKKRESIFKWRGWADIFGGVLAGNLK